jgi:alpha-1,3-fucosyltransferase
VTLVVDSYVAELQRHIDVDVFGLCGKFRCAVDRADDCINMLERRYFFYLSFENSLCVDYITEKFWRLVDRDVIAVTLGAGNYSAFVPPDTYLDVRDFRSPRHLAERMRKLMADGGQLYAEMLDRKRRVRCKPSVDSSAGFGEKLCRYLVDTRGQRQTRDLDEVWNTRTMCVDAKMFYRGVADLIANGTY